MSEGIGGGATAPSQGAPATAGNPQAPQSPGASPSPQAAPQRHKVKVNGSEMELSTDDLIKGYQLGQASHQRFQQASEMEKRYKPLAEALGKKDFKALMSSVPEAEFRNFAEQYLYERYQYEQLPEGERRRIQAEQRASQLEQDLQRERQGKESEAAQRSYIEAAAQVDNDIAATLEAIGKKPTPYLVVAIVDEMLAAEQASEGKQRLTAKDAYERGRRRLTEQAESYIADLPDADLVGYLERTGKLDGVRKHLLNQVMGAQPKRVQPSTPQAKPRGEVKPKNIDDWFKTRETQLRKGG